MRALFLSSATTRTTGVSSSPAAAPAPPPRETRLAARDGRVAVVRPALAALEVVDSGCGWAPPVADAPGVAPEGSLPVGAEAEPPGRLLPVPVLPPPGWLPMREPSAAAVVPGAVCAKRLAAPPPPPEASTSLRTAARSVARLFCT